ncbi:peroxisomal membrane protein PEX13-like [Hydractinia symbiolongicarpus]|uniref:peroxisomal membrane protein PEX13-like n=1 Tax=Hydractinia symbiolongicarpus TaxID=13093 RepID=UPI00254BFE57|nr:peroxisomal membrane protein PEX13-like [Hydractinia symbiolongicarpus]
MSSSASQQWDLIGDVKTHNPDNQRYGLSRMSYMNDGGISSENKLPNQPPPVPRRPNAGGLLSQSPSLYTPGYGSSMYGNPYQSFMYGGPSMGYSGYGMRGNYDGSNSILGGVEDVTQSAFESVGSVIQAFSSVSMMLESTLFALQHSVRAIVSVADQFSHLRLHLLTSCISMLRTIKYYFNKLMVLFHVRNKQTDESIWKEVMQGANSTGDTKQWPVVLFFAIVVGTPWLMWKLLRNVVSTQDVNSKWQKGVGEHYLAEVKFSFSAENRDELSITCGDIIRIAPKNKQPRVRGWILASDGENQGIVPANYITILGKNRSNTSKEELKFKEKNKDKTRMITQTEALDKLNEAWSSPTDQNDTSS